MSDTIDTFLDETLKPLGRLRGATTEESSILQKVDFETAKASIKQFIENRVREAKGEVVKKCNATGKKSRCPRCEYPALFERAIGGTECIVCEYQMPF
jgi:hypothetical protein